MLTIGIAAFLASLLTLFSGFGLGTILTPVFALFVPVQSAIAATAVVHLANNLFKLLLVGRHADWRVVARFGAPAAASALVGATVLLLITGFSPLVAYQLAGRLHVVTPVKVVVGVLIVVFAVLELGGRLERLAVPPRYLPLGGALSGFFGGLSGNQGALRAAFLVKAGLSRDAFIATGVVCAVVVDVVRLAAYGASQLSDVRVFPSEAMTLVWVATAAALAGAALGARVLRKLTLRAVQVVVALMMVVIGVALVAGLA